MTVHHMEGGTSSLDVLCGFLQEMGIQRRAKVGARTSLLPQPLGEDGLCIRAGHLAAQYLEYMIDAACQLPDVIGLDGRIHSDPQLVAA